MTYLSLLAGLAVLFFCFGAFGCLLGLVCFFVAPTWPETHSQVAQADLCTLCTQGGSIRAKKTSGFPGQNHELMETYAHVK